MTARSLRIAFSAGLGALVAASPASANMLVPLVAQGWLILVVLLLPIIAVETVCLSLRLGGAFWQALKVATLTNLASTFCGIPMACLLHWCLGIVTPYRLKTRWQRLLTAWVHAPWQIGATDSTEQRLGVHMTMQASLVLLVVFFLASWLVEALVAIKLLPNIEPESVGVGVLVGNLATYGLLVWFAWYGSDKPVEEPKKTRSLSAPERPGSAQCSPGLCKVELPH